MNRSIFCRSIILLASFFSAFLANAADSGREYYELRVYTTKSEQQQKLVTEYWEKAAGPAYNRLGSQSVGVFTELEDSATNKIYVLIPFNSANAAASAASKLAADATYQKAAETFMAIPKNDPAYVRFDSSLLLAMEGMKKLAVPPSTAEKKPWIFELRTYFSHNEDKGINKVEMFNAGEIQIMKDVGLNPVFFSQTILGPNMPSLIYMVSGENKEEHRKHFGGFGSHPLWKKLSADPQYKDNVSGIKSVFLKRTSASQI
jgi:hypothetical protein